MIHVKQRSCSMAYCAFDLISLTMEFLIMMLIYWETISPKVRIDIKSDD